MARCAVLTARPAAHSFVESPRNAARWWGETHDGFGYDATATGAGNLEPQPGIEHMSTPIGGNIDHYVYPRRHRGRGHRFDWSPSTPKKVWGRVWYGDTKVYGGSVGRDFAAQPYPRYTDYMTEDAARAAGVEQQYSTRNLEMPPGYMDGFAEDFFAYFPAEDRAGEEVPDPIEAGYWPYATADGTVAAGDAGATGAAWRSFAEEDAKSDAGAVRAAEADADDDADVDKYLDAESSVYTNDMRFYLNDDWP